LRHDSIYRWIKKIHGLALLLLSFSVFLNILVVLLAQFGDDWQILYLVITIPLSVITTLFFLLTIPKQLSAATESGFTADNIDAHVKERWIRKRYKEASTVFLCIFALTFSLIYFGSDEDGLLIYIVAILPILTVFTMITISFFGAMAEAKGSRIYGTIMAWIMYFISLMGVFFIDRIWF
jgi:hypothetical protein